MSLTVHTRALARAAEILGGADQLRVMLNVSPARLSAWMEGMETPPPDVFLRVVDVVLEREFSHLPRAK